VGRSYHIVVARHVVAADDRWVDNLLARFDLPGVESSGKGTSRRISALGIYHVALVSDLVDSVGLSIESACRLAARLFGDPPGDAVTPFPGVEIRFDRATFVAGVDARISEAVEAIAVPRRGRPRRGP
jgi:hypothetical protein